MHRPHPSVQKCFLERGLLSSGVTKRLRPGRAQVAGEGAVPLDASSPPRGEGRLGPRPSLLILAGPRTTSPSASLSEREGGGRSSLAGLGHLASHSLPLPSVVLCLKFNLRFLLKRMRERGKRKSHPGLKSGGFLRLTSCLRQGDRQCVLSSPWPDKFYANEKLFPRLPARVRPLSKERRQK